MTTWLQAAGLSALLLVAAMADARAEEGMVLWDRHIATAMNEMLLGDDQCARGGPYAAFARSCSKSLNVPIGPRAPELTTLDRVALFVNKHKDLNMKRDLRPGTRLRFKAKLSNLYKQEAEVRLTLRIKF